MKERIYSIPLTDALKENCGCALCSIEKKLEQDAAEYFLGPSLMEPDGRAVTNAKGFCKRHIKMLYDKGNRLGLALMLETHTKHLDVLLQPQKKEGLFKKPDKNISKELLDAAHGCALCDKLYSQMKDAAENFVYLFDSETDFKALFKRSGGLCLSHAALVLKEAPGEFGGKKLDRFNEAFLAFEREKFGKLYENLHEFTLSFDYRNTKKELSQEAKNSVDEALISLCKFTD